MMSRSVAIAVVISGGLGYLANTFLYYNLSALKEEGISGVVPGGLVEAAPED